ncbi:MAG: hypothetical protein QM490_05595 [Candidatus Gracilibacteria bacterium]
MKINKKEIIDEIISLEPELNADRVKLENILEDIINMKPDINISSKFKEQLKEKLLLELKGKSKIYVNSKNNTLKLLISFLFGGITVYSMIGIFGINLGLFNIDETENIELVGIEQIQEPVAQRAMPTGFEIGIMEISTESVEEVSVMTEEALVENTDLFTELRTYLENLGLDNKIIEEILNIIRKYK